ncbi:MAG: hypothetical protein IPO92_06565 [Saprospiraceae bacterium]|nr:hypothetical protein [Saprospiraceae bacterium]
MIQGSVIPIRVDNIVNCEGTITYTWNVTDYCNRNLSYTQVLTILNCTTITVTNPTITSGFANAPFSQTFTAYGGITPYTFTTGSTVPGLTFASTGVLSGTSTTPGTYNITATATDANGCTGTGLNYSLLISANACSSGVVSQLGSATSNTSTSAFGSNTINGLLFLQEQTGCLL